MDRFLKIGIDHSRAVLIVLAIVTVAALVQLPQLRLEITAEGMMVEGDPARALYEDALATFGSENVTVLYFESDTVLAADQLRSIAGALAVIDASPLVSRTVSLFSLRYLRTIDGFSYTSPYLKKIPKDPGELRRLLEAALDNPLAADNLISDRLNVIAINVYVDQLDYYRGFDEDFSKLLTDSVEGIRDQFVDVFFVGNPYVRVGLSDRIRHDQQIIVPGAIACLLLTLALLLRKPVAALIPLLTALLSIVWILGLMAALDVPINVTTSVIPALLIIIGSTEDIHLITEYRHAAGTGKGRPAALDQMARHMGTAVLLTFVTTYTGFLSIASNQLGLLQQFGLLASTGLLFNFIITVLLVPICLNALPDDRGVRPGHNSRALNRFALWLFLLTQNHRYKVLSVLAVATAVSLLLAGNLRVNNNVMDYFADDSSLVRYADKLHENLSGIQTLAFVVSGPPGTFEKVASLQQLWAIQDYIELTEGFDSSYSFADFIGMVHSGLDDDNGGEIYLPDNNDVVREYMAFLHQGIAQTLVSHDFSKARIVVRHAVGDSSQINEKAAAVVQYAITQLTPFVTIGATGESYLNSRAIDYMAEGQGLSLLLILTTIFLVVSVLFTHVKAGVIAALANVFPIIVLFAVMGYFDMALNTSTAMVAAISLGIGVDYSMHFMVRYYRLAKNEVENYKALRRTVYEESLPIIASAVALAASFAALTISNFPPVARFGQLSAMVMVLSLISTFVILPLMLRHTRLITVWDVLSVSIKKRVVHQSEFFRGMRTWQARKILALSNIRRYRQDEAIILQGDNVDHMYLVLDGAAEGWRTRRDGSTYIAGVYLSGSVFGVMLPGSDQRCLVDVVATQDTSVLTLDWHDLHKITRVSPRLGAQLFRNLSSVIGSYVRQLEATDAAIHDELSGAYSRTVMQESITWVFHRAARYQESFSLVAVCLDGLNGGNLQHHARNLVLRAVAASIDDGLRSSDVLGRWNDNTFCVSLPNTDGDAAQYVTARMNRVLSRNTLCEKYGVVIRMLSISRGDDEKDPDEFIRRFENILGNRYPACGTGGNRDAAGEMVIPSLPVPLPDS